MFNRSTDQTLLLNVFQIYLFALKAVRSAFLRSLLRNSPVTWKRLNEKQIHSLRYEYSLVELEAIILARKKSFPCLYKT